MAAKLGRGKWALLILVAILVAAYSVLDLGQHITLEAFVEKKAAIDAYYQNHPVLLSVAYFIAYIAVFALALPVAAALSLAGGAVFGLFWGVVIISFASSIGSLLAFLVSRYVMRDAVQRRFASHLQGVNEGVEKDGGFYLFSLRLVPIFPPAVINLAMGLSKMKARLFYVVSQIGMLPGTIVYVNAGTELGQVGQQGDVLTPGLVGAFLALAIFPWVAKFIMVWLNAKKAYRGFVRPKQYDANLIVIGAGSGGLVAALIAATVKAKVMLIEREKMGGDCLNTGCVPSKALIRAAKVAHEVRHASALGIKTSNTEIDFKAVMQHVKGAIAAIEPHDSVERFTSLGVECIAGNARFVSPWQLEVDGKMLSAKKMIIATGARPFVPPIPGIDTVHYVTSDTVWSLDALPKRLLVMGGGPIGCELAQAFARLGSQVTIVDMEDRLLPREDVEVSAYVQEVFTREKINVFTQHVVHAFYKKADGESTVQLTQSDKQQLEIAFDTVLVAVGRKANTHALGLEEIGVELNRNGTVQTDSRLQTALPNIYACGDVVGPYQFTHIASHQAWYATVNALFGRFKSFAVDYRVIPWATFIDPEVARVGLSEAEAKEQGIEYEVTRYGIDDLDRAIADAHAEGFVKVLTAPGKDKILGATIVGYHASDLLTEFVTAMKNKHGLKRILGTIHAYPTVSEANKFVASEWVKKRKPERLLSWIEKYHRWTRN